MGKPVWALLNFVPHWQWLLERADSPWYSSVLLFRQRAWGDWTRVFDQAAAELLRWSNQRMSLSAIKPPARFRGTRLDSKSPPRRRAFLFVQNPGELAEPHGRLFFLSRPRKKRDGLSRDLVSIWAL
jgi:hypothetical protein